MERSSSDRAPRSDRITRVRALVIVIVSAFASSACSSGAPPGMDAGRERDGRVLDSTFTFDDASTDALSPSDAARTDGGSAFVCGGACDPRDVLGCVDTRCVLGAAEPACVMEVGVLLPGASCEDVAACAPGLACFADGATGLGVCAEVCCPGDTTCGVERRCGGPGELASGALTAWGQCLSVRACDLAHPEYVCTAREGCYIVDSEGHTECLIAGRALEGESCEESSDCAAGGVCTGITEKTCARVCILETPRDCGTDRRCEAQAYSPAGTGICTPSIL